MMSHMTLLVFAMNYSEGSAPPWGTLQFKLIGGTVYLHYEGLRSILWTETIATQCRRHQFSAPGLTTDNAEVFVYYDISKLQSHNDLLLCLNGLSSKLFLIYVFRILLSAPIIVLSLSM